MNALLVSIGTDGDILPYAALGAVLRARGHQATLVASEQYESLAKGAGLDFQPLVSREENDALFGHPDFWNPLKTAPLSARWGVRFLRRQYDLLAKLVGSESVMVANPAVFAAGLVHETKRVPWANLVLQPWVIPSPLAPPAMPYFSFLSRAPATIWKLFYRGIDVMGDSFLSRELNGLRATLGLKPRRRILGSWYSKQRVIGLFPNWYGQPQADWPAQLQLVGFPEFDSRPGDALAPELLEFCRAGSAPVAFTFGTGMAHSARLFETALEACAILGARGILLTKYRHELPKVLPPGTIHCSFAPFQKLFPHCAAVMHHGGIGTVADAMAAGLPQLIRPICFDQLDNGLRIRRLGAGDFVRSTRSRGRHVAAALAALMTEGARSRCRELMPRFGQSDALTSTAESLESLVSAGVGCRS